MTITDIHRDHRVTATVQAVTVAVAPVVILRPIFRRVILEAEAIQGRVTPATGDRTKIIGEIMIEDLLRQMLIPSAPSLPPFSNVSLNGCKSVGALCFT